MKSNWYWRVFPGDFPQQICLFQIILNHLKNSVLTPQGVCSWHKMANFFYCQNFLPDLKGVFSRDWPGITSPPAITWYRHHTIIYTRSVFLLWSKMHLKDFLRNCKKMMMMMTMVIMIMKMQSDAVRWPSKAIFFPFETFSSEQQKKQAAGSFCKFGLKLRWKYINISWFQFYKEYIILLVKSMALKTGNKLVWFCEEGRKMDSRSIACFDSRGKCNVWALQELQKY